MQEIVGPLQSSFIPGRGTTDNAIILQEIVHFMNQKRKNNKNVVFKLDLEKAYDRVDWHFLHATLNAFGFPSSINALIMHCVSSASLSILWNGIRLPSFRSSRGLQQGDPLSLYLFVLCMERLAHMIQHEVSRNNWKPDAISQGGPTISHLFFADDVLLFTKAEVDQVRVVHGVLERFCRASGLRVNVAKSKAMASLHVSEGLKERIVVVTSIPFTANLGKYLGFPIIYGRVKKEDYTFIVERITRRLAAWKGKLLNEPGRVTLVRSVISAILVYVMQLNWLPQAICDQIDAIARRFIWGSETRRGVSLVVWEKIAKPRRHGGLGIRCARLNNVALLGKHLWSLLHEQDKFWVQIVRSRYNVDRDILTCQSSAGSPFWRSVLRARAILADGYVFRLGCGSSSFWYSNWSPLGLLCNLVPFVSIHDTQLSVKDVFASSSCNFSLLYTMLPDQVIQTLSYIQVMLDDGTPDCFVWQHQLEGQYSAHGGYDWLLSRQPNGPLTSWTWVWKLPVPDNIRFCVWQAVHDSVPTRALLHHRSLIDSAVCLGCGKTVETFFHCVRDCTTARQMEAAPIVRDAWGQLTVIGKVYANSGVSPPQRWLMALWLCGFASGIGIADSLKAELLAILRGLELCWQLGYRRVELSSDSQTAMGLLAHAHPVFHHYSSVLGRIKDLLQREWEVHRFHLLREGNAPADYLAKLGATTAMGMEVWTTPPTGISALLLADAMGTEFLRL
ncbi:uncharacterized protein LOC130735982 [Lotus japonicus]|uniref:uncharacterized protein LOC130735982 n=1 Tax=Lotus japonicus TaxID=34305 RepID=UPI0025869E7A|nr:uncharacterized protein LOC130735982 [Lotus japonicus]